MVQMLLSAHAVV